MHIAEAAALHLPFSAYQPVGDDSFLTFTDPHTPHTRQARLVGHTPSCADAFTAASMRQLIRTPFCTPLAAARGTSFPTAMP
mmetsp:Transcript_11294/g.28494  ORF Transcript_11294/g.28494 Transcript_11294/m.28494 type:complete len:82 (+) Transcript_11294:165-410(+)